MTLAAIFVAGDQNRNTDFLRSAPGRLAGRQGGTDLWSVDDLCSEARSIRPGNGAVEGWFDSAWIITTSTMLLARIEGPVIRSARHMMTEWWSIVMYVLSSWQSIIVTDRVGRVSSLAVVPAIESPCSQKGWQWASFPVAGDQKHRILGLDE